MTTPDPRHEPLPLKDAVDFTLAEARMVLPGVQAIFGFQLIVPFNERFASALAPGQQALHLVALVLTGVAMALVMTPAAYHRRVLRETVSRTLLKVASRLISAGMIVLAVGLSLDVYVVTVLVLAHGAVAWTVAAAFFAGVMVLWVVFPGGARTRRK